MELTITSISENPLLERKEVELELDHTGESTPATEDVKNRFAAENNVEPESIDVESVKTAFGSNLSTATLKIYEEFDYEEDLEESQKEEQPTSQETEVEETVDETEDKSEEAEEEAEPEGKETEESGEADYDEIVDNTIGDAKDALNDLDEPDFEAALEAEKSNKDRKTFKEWLENKVE